MSTEQISYRPLLEETTSVKPSRSRWEMLACFVSLTCCSQISWIMYSAVPDASMRAFGASAVAVTTLATSFPLLYYPGSVLAARAMRAGGLRAAVLGSARWNCGGAVLKCVGGGLACAGLRRCAFAAAMLGQVLAALGQPHLVNTPVALATDWFEASERDSAATLAFLGNILGQAIGEAVSPVIVAAAQARGLSSTQALLVLCAVALAPTVASACWAWARFENGTLAVRDDAAPACEKGLLREWYSLLRGNADFRKLWFAFCLGIAFFNALLEVAAQWLAPCGYSAKTVGSLTATFVLLGVPGAALAGCALDATRAYRPALKFLSSSAAVSTAALVWFARPGNVAVLYVAFSALGASMIASSAVLMETAVECTYPAKPELSTGALFVGGNTLTVVVAYAIELLLKTQRGTCAPLGANPAKAPVAYLCVALVGTCAAILISYNGPYKRLEAERRAQATATPHLPYDPVR